ncbi:Abi family protein [Celeribacter halophilus]|uniref:Abi-like protein n=1 Tax=Celeribacter halophilus TaxID=576117 RepID=A0A1I3QNH7_9RHOB|nr:Abi family protein [Celeribacter halophilus]PZX13400.1 Abi-like protein [Celeribacter halophilus]SFJ34677.1 Abi-like protein [Celeribacter halophilus]
MTDQNGSQKTSEAAPEGPPHDLVRRRGQKPAEAPKGNLTTSHTSLDSDKSHINQVPSLTDLTIQKLLTESLSERRLQRYAPAAGDAGVAREDIYLWNCDLADAFQFALHMAEITCRNSIHSALLYKGDRWFEDSTFRKLLDGPRLNDLDMALADERAQHAESFDTHHLVSALSFGFWEHLTTKRFKRYLFPKGFQKNFKHAPWKAELDELHDLIESVRRWRNRIAHHNAVFDKGPSAKYQDALTLISWSSPALETWVAGRCRVNQIINARPRGKE